MTDEIEIQLPDQISIPIPMQRPRGHGMYAAIGAIKGLQVTVRCATRETDVLKRACAILGIPPASFMRDVAVNTAEKIVELANAHQRRDRS